jgi:tetratricopeptide (TPR) repeat protein
MADLQTVSALRQQGRRALERAAYGKAVQYFEQALEALGQFPKDRQTLEWAVDVRFELRAALLRLGESARILPLLQEAAELANALHDVRRLGRIADYMTVHHWHAGAPDLAVLSGQKARRLAARCGELSLQVATSYHLGLALYTLGLYQQASVLFTQIAAALTGAWNYKRLGLEALPSITARVSLAWCQSEIGVFDKSYAASNEAVEIAETDEHPLGLLAAYAGLGYVSLRRGDVARAVPILERGLALGQRQHHELSLAVFTVQLGYALALNGRLVEALPILQEAAAHLAAVRQQPGHALRAVWLGEGYLLVASFDEALTHATQAYELARASKEHGTRAWALRLLGMLASSRGPSGFQEAQTYSRQALTLATKLDMRPLVAHCHLSLGSLYKRLARLPQAEAELSTAIGLYRDMAMPFWLARTGTVLAQ